jgi:tetratricopeptide (TPR) repeat protein
MKVLLDGGDLDRTAVARFDAEAKAASGLHHPNLAGIHDYGVTDNGAPYVVMDFVDGVPLSQRLLKGPLPQDEALKLFIQICTGLEFAHAKNIVHRDIKPSNIMISAEGQNAEVRIVDFGIAKELRPAGTNNPALTQTGEVIGSPQYMSPEQCTGSLIDARTDIYSLGCTMFESLTGKPPFTADNVIQVIFKQVNERPALFKTIAPGIKISSSLERIVMQALEKEPENRYQTASDIKRDLELVAEGKNPVKEVSTARRTVRGAAKFTKILVGLSLVAAVTIGAVMLAFNDQWNPAVPWVAKYQAAKQQMSVGNRSEAEVYYKQALELAPKGQADSGNIENILLELSRVQGDTNQHEQAIASLTKALALSTARPEGSVSTAHIQDQLAQEYLDTRQYEAAEKAARIAVDLKTKVYGVNNWFTGHSVSRLTIALRHLRRYDQAEKYARQLVEIETHLFPKQDNVELADAYRTLGNALTDQGKKAEALTNLRKALTIQIKLNGPGHPSVQQLDAQIDFMDAK